MPWRRLRWLERGALIVGLLSLGLWSRAQLRSWAFQTAESKRLASEAAESKDSGTSSPEIGRADGVKRDAGSPDSRAEQARPVASLGRLEIPRLGIRAMVAEGTDTRTLDLAVGHIAATARPGSPGNCGLAGHRDTFFSSLGGVRVGDQVHLSTPERTYTYEVVWSRVVEPNRVDTLDPTAVPSLTLVTCYPFTYVGHAPKRFVVRARQVDAEAAPVTARTRGAHARVANAAPVLMAAGR